MDWVDHRGAFVQLRKGLFTGIRPEVVVGDTVTIDVAPADICGGGAVVTVGGAAMGIDSLMLESLTGAVGEIISPSLMNTLALHQAEERAPSFRSRSQVV